MTILSFTIDHTTLLRGVYASKKMPYRDKITTLDIY